MDEPHPASQVFITVAGNRYRLIPTDKFLSPELRELKRSSGMALSPFEQAIKDADWDAWFAWIYVSIRRARPDLTEAQLEQEIGDTPPVAVIGTVENETPEVAAPDDPLSTTSTSGNDEPPNESGSGAKTPPSSISEPSGHPTSGTQT